MSNWEKRFNAEIEKIVHEKVRRVCNIWTKNETRWCGEGTCEFENDLMYVEYDTMDGSRRTECMETTFLDFMRNLEPR